MDEQTRKEITRLLLEQVAIDEAKKKQIFLITTSRNFKALLKGAITAGFDHLHPAWGILLYLQRN